MRLCPMDGGSCRHECLLTCYHNENDKPFEVPRKESTSNGDPKTFMTVGEIRAKFADLDDSIPVVFDFDEGPLIGVTTITVEPGTGTYENCTLAEHPMFVRLAGEYDLTHDRIDYGTPLEGPRLVVPVAQPFEPIDDAYLLQPGPGKDQ